MAKLYTLCKKTQKSEQKFNLIVYYKSELPYFKKYVAYR